MKIGVKEARRKAFEFAAETFSGADWGAIWGDEIADAAFLNSHFALVLVRAQREVTERLRRLADPTPPTKEP